MPVDPAKRRKILVVHGVQSGTDADILLDKKVKELLESRMGDLDLDFDAEMYRYENINDKALNRFRKVTKFFLGHLLEKIPVGRLAGTLIENGIDLIGDVVLNVTNGSTAVTIRKGLSDKILGLHEQGYPLYLVAHSLGSIYAFDVVNELIRGGEGFFARDDRKTWPVQGLITLGSPLGLPMFTKGRRLESFGTGRKYFRWINYWARTDPVVSGSFYGKPKEGYRIAELFRPRGDSGWFIQDRIVETGGAWMNAHISYWTCPGFGDDLLTMIAS